MKQRTRNSFYLLMLASFFLAPALCLAQEITGSVRGTVLAPAGNPAVGTSVTVTDTRTGAIRRVTTTESGAYHVRGLSIGGPFTIRFDSTEYRATEVTDVFTKLSGAKT